jgi:hypothetical protein
METYFFRSVIIEMANYLFKQVIIEMATYLFRPVITGIFSIILCSSVEWKQYVYLWVTISCEKVKMIITEKYHMAHDQWNKWTRQNICIKYKHTAFSWRCYGGLLTDFVCLYTYEFWLSLC